MFFLIIDGNKGRLNATYQQKAQSEENLFLRIYGNKEKHKVLSDKEPYVLWSMIPINILINRKPEHNHESSRSRRKRKEAQRVKQQRKWSKLTGKLTTVKMEVVMQ